jgi:hypothetical protein
LGERRAILAVVLAGAVVTYGGVSLFVAYFVLGPMALTLFKAADIPRRLMPATIALGTSTFTMTALPGTPAVQNAIPMPFFGTTPFAAPGLGIALGHHSRLRTFWLGHYLGPNAAQERFSDAEPGRRCKPPGLRGRAATSHAFDLAEIERGHRRGGFASREGLLPLVRGRDQSLMSLFILPRGPSGRNQWGWHRFTRVRVCPSCH